MNATHALADLTNIHPSPLKAEIKGEIQHALTEAAAATKLTPVHPPIVEQLAENEVVGFILLAESHISIHFYPDQKLMKVDVFSCGSESPIKGLEKLAEHFQARLSNINVIDRTRVFPP